MNTVPASLSEINAHLFRQTGDKINTPSRMSLPKEGFFALGQCHLGLPRQHSPALLRGAHLLPWKRPQGGNALQLLQEAPLGGRPVAPPQALGGVAPESRARVPGSLFPGQRPHKVVLGKTEIPLVNLATDPELWRLPSSCI